MPDKPKHVEEELKKFSKTKLPHFFKYAKDKEEHQVSSINSSTVNMLEEIIPNTRIQFKDVAGKMDYELLMTNVNVEVDKEVIKKYDTINRMKKVIMGDLDDDKAFNKYITDALLEINPDITIIVDSLIKTLFERNSINKTTLWNAFGEYMYANLESKLGKSIQCDTCTVRFEKKSSTHVLCDDCKKEKQKIKNKEKSLKYYHKNK